MLRKTLIFILISLFCQTTFSYLMTTEDEELLDMNYPLKYLFWSGCIVFIGILRHFIRTYDISISYSVICILVGILWGIAALYNPWMYKVAKVAQSNKILYNFSKVYVPVIIFTTAFSIDTHIFFKCLTQILIISGPVALVCATLTGLMMELITETIWLLTHALIFGIITVCIYPMDVLGYLKESNVQTKYIISLLHGETLMATSAATFIYTLLVRSGTGWVVHWYQFAMGAVRFTLGLPIGYIFGKMSTWFMKYSFNSVPQLMLLTIVSCFVPFFVSRWIASNGVLTTLVVGIMMDTEKGSLSQETQDALSSQWKLMSCAFNGVLFIMVGVRAPTILYGQTDFKEYILVFVTYLVSNISRFLSFFFFSPILKRFGYGLSFQHLIICVWCGLKNPLSLMYIIDLDEYFVELTDQRRQTFLHILGLYVLMSCINGSFLPVVLRALGLAEISTTRQVNMNNCVKHIYEARTRMVAILKMDRFLSDANWPLVMTNTVLKHPYKKTVIDDQKTDEDEEEDFFLGYRFTYCPDCQKHIPNEPTPKEFKEMTKEAKQRILKLKKTIYSRQYETAVLTREGVRMLHQAVEIALDTEAAIIELDGLMSMFDQENNLYKYFRNQLQILLQTKTDIYKPPRNKLFLFCYHLMNNRCYLVFILFTIFLNIILLLLELGVDMDIELEYEINLSAHFTFFFIYFLEFWMRVFGLSWMSIWTDGFPGFFKSIWNIILFLSMGLPLVVFILGLAVVDDDVQDSEIVYIDIVSLVLLVLRVLGAIIRLKILTLFNKVAMRMVKVIDIKVNKHKALAYVLGKNYITGEEEILENLYQIVDNVKIRQDLKQKTVHDRHTLSRRLGLAQKERPVVASTVKTKAAIRAVLSSMKDDIYELKVSGWVDDVEYTKLLASLAERFKYVSSMNYIEPSAPKLIFREVPYMGDDDAIIEFLWSNIATRKYDPGGVVIDEGEEADGIYIIITGMFLVNYIPNETVVNLVKETGAMPVIDYICSNSFDEPAFETFIPGNAIGELSTLTRRTYDGRVTAETHSEAYFLSATTIRKAIEMDPDPVNGLECRMWKTLCFKTAVEVMTNVPAYRTLNHDKIQYLVERAFVPNLSNYKIFVVNEMMHDIILVEGVVVDYNTRDMYTAPCYIPRAVQKLILPRSSLVNMQATIETKLMIIPAKDYDEYEVMINEEQVSELVDQNSEKCLHKLIQSKLSDHAHKGSRHRALKMEVVKKFKKKMLSTTDSNKSKITFASSQVSKSSKTSKKTFD